MTYRPSLKTGQENLRRKSTARSIFRKFVKMNDITSFSIYALVVNDFICIVIFDFVIRPGQHF